jgi:hypothetical protein
MIKTIIIVGGLIVLAVTVTVVVIEHQSRPSGQVPDLDAAMVETGKNLHPPKLNP